MNKEMKKTEDRKWYTRTEIEGTGDDKNKTL